METLELEQEKQRLETLSRYEILDSPQEPAFDDLTALATRFCNAPISFISFLDREREWFKSKIGTDLQQIPRTHAFAERAIRSGELVVIPDAEKDEDLRDNPLVREEPHIRFFAGLPLITPDGKGLGALCILDQQPHDFDPRQQQLLRILTHEAMSLLEMRRIAHETRKEKEALADELTRVRGELTSETAKHRQIELELKRQEQQLADAQRLTHLGSWEWDIRNNQIIWSDELYRIYGVAPGEFPATYAAYLKYVHPEDRARASMTIEQALVSRGRFRSEERIIRKDGSIRTLSTCGEVIQDAHGEPVRMVGTCHDITERKEIENKLHQSLSLLRATLESTADGLLVVDLEGHVVRYNNKFAELWHIPAPIVGLYDDERLLSLVLDQLSDAEGFYEKVRKLYETPDATSFDILKFKDGRTYERFSCPQKIGDKIVGRVWSFRDVTERCRALEVLSESEQRYRSLVEASAQIVWTADAKGSVIEESPSWRKFTGQSFREMRDRGWLKALHPRDRNRVAELWRHAVTTGQIYETEFQVRRFDGAWRQISVRGVPVRENNGTIREWIGFCIDITEKKRAEDAVMQERDFSNALINSLPGIFYVLDETGLNLRWNKDLEQVTGYSRQEISRMHAINFVPLEERPLLAERVRKVFTIGSADIEVNLLTKAGKRIPFYCTGRLVHLDGQPRLVGVGIDISARKDSEKQSKRVNKELEARVAERTAALNSANKELESFTYTASHDLRAPLRAVTCFARAIQDDCFTALDKEHQEYLERIIQAGDRMMQLIDDLLGYCRVGRQTVQTSTVNLGEIIPEIVEGFKPRLKALGGEITICNNLPQIQGDPVFIRQIFWNILENAVNYRKKDEPLRIDILSDIVDDNVIISVRDNGIGIAPEHHKRIFNVFERLHTNDEYVGTGIGLATVKKSAEKLGGDVWVESDLGKGATFRVQLKRATE